MTTISFDPQQTTSATDSFVQTTEGWVQGTFFDDPTTQNQLTTGFIASSVTQAVWGGMAITEDIPTVGNNQGGNNLVLATAPSNITGFTIFNQAYNGVLTPGNNVAQFGSGFSISYFRLDSNARIAVQCSTALANSLGNGSSATNSQVSWDFNDQILVPYSAGYTGTITGATWTSTNGGTAVFTVGTDPTTNVPVGTYLDVSGVVSSGGSATDAYNGSWLVTARNTTTITVLLPAASTPGTYSIGGTAAVVGGAIAVKVLQFNTNSKIVSYNPSTGAVTWTTGPAAIIQI